MVGLVGFLLARIAEDQVEARAAAPGPWGYSDVESIPGGTVYDPTVAIANVEYDVEPVDVHIRRTRTEEQADATGRHIARHDPARVLAECAAKRAIVELHVGRHECVGDRHGHRGTVLVAEGFVHEHDPTLLLLAQVHADHPDFDPAWAVTT